MAHLVDVARFRPDDAEALVAAAFACPWCLAVDCDAVLDAAPGDASCARCACAACEEPYDVVLEARQVLRLTLAPPVADDHGGAAVRLRVGQPHGFPWST